ncbi:hypothetical protein [Cellulomonas composti]|uniref:Uncharacterized protein n=1 Tax=Cellulomonas composti TaxID=266130 RepID=A0A511J617_9CELL|nr:hypothetical protein [Cellulomonas composti]GEL93434.1 hypothetical protein CCO02nite_00920 [Cellulomonas composti]
MILRAADEQDDALDVALEALVNTFAAFHHHRDDDVLAQALAALDLAPPGADFPQPH